MNITLDLSKHCVETEVRRLHNSAISAYFKAKKDREALEDTIALTQYALESFDFSKLRSQYPPLAGHTCLQVVLSMDDDVVTILIDGSPVVSTT